MTSYAALFISALVAATILPMQSEALLVALLVLGDKSIVGLVLIATFGNVIGSVFNWYVGRFLTRFQHKRWFPASAKQLAKAENWYFRYGRWSLLASWLPVIGDPITVMAGALGERFMPFLFLVTLAKGSRYTALALATVSWL